jgi:urea carboxylase-associated protein 1
MTIAPAPLLDVLLPARAPFSTKLKAGQELAIVDVEGNQAVDFLVFGDPDTTVRYSAAETIAAQQNIFLSTGSVLYSADGEPLLRVIADECGRHDTLGGACSKESNTLRYGQHTRHQHACVENFLLAGAAHGLGKVDLVSNVNWFMNVPVEADGTLGIVDGISAPGLAVTLRAERDVLVLISNCPQINNPCNGFSPSPIRLLVSHP